LIAESAADQTWQAFDEEIDPAFNVACRILVIEVSIADEDIVFSRQSVYSGDAER